MAMEQRQRRRPLTRQEQLALQERKQRRREKMEESRELARGPIDVTFCLLVLLPILYLRRVSAISQTAL